MRFASEGGVEWRQASGGAEQQLGRVAASLLLQGDLPAQVLRLCRRVGAQLCSLECDEKPQRRFEARSEEHTSELQSHVNLVCRLLLEKKKKKKKKHKNKKKKKKKKKKRNKKKKK